MRRFLLASLLLLAPTVRATIATPVSPAPLPGGRPGQTPGGQERAAVPLLAHRRVLVLGDSITEDGRYVTFLEYYLHRFAPGADCDLISIGLSSETISGLNEPGLHFPRPCALERLDRALQAVKPSVVLACYGMNDGIYHPSSPGRLDAFRAGLRQLLEKVRAAGARLVLITPPVFDPQPIRAQTVTADSPEFGYGHFFDGYDTVLAEFAAMEVAQSAPDVTVIDVHRVMASALTERRSHEPAFTFSPDGVHPDETGHLLMARVIATGLGLELPAAGIEAELARLQADPLLSLVRDRRSLRSEAWLPFVGYTSGQAFKSDSVTAAERVAARLQEQINAAAVK